MFAVLHQDRINNRTEMLFLFVFQTHSTSMLACSSQQPAQRRPARTPHLPAHIIHLCILTFKKLPYLCVGRCNLSIELQLDRSVRETDWRETSVMSRILTYDPSVGIGELADPISVLRCLQAYEASLANELSTLEGERQRCHEYSRMYGSKAWKTPLETLNLKIISTENSLREIKFHINLFHSHVRGGAELCRRMAHQFGVPQHLMFQ